MSAPIPGCARSRAALVRSGTPWRSWVCQDRGRPRSARRRSSDGRAGSWRRIPPGRAGRQRRLATMGRRPVAASGRQASRQPSGSRADRAIAPCSRRTAPDAPRPGRTVRPRHPCRAGPAKAGQVAQPRSTQSHRPPLLLARATTGSARRSHRWRAIPGYRSGLASNPTAKTAAAQHDKRSPCDNRHRPG
jgi:hypothetical protein